MAEKKERGVMYLVLGEEYLEEVVRSVKSLKEYHPDMPVTLYTDVEPEDEEMFDEVVVMEDPRGHLIEKIHYLKDPPYKETLYMDDDTYIAGDISGMFDILENFDIVMSLASVRSLPKTAKAAGFESEVPEAFPKLNCGVFTIKDTEKVRSFFEEWEEEYEKYYETPINDQPIFRELIYDSGLRVCTLPQEYNCRVYYSGYADGKVKILHSRPEYFRRPYNLTKYTYEELEQAINSETSPRVFYMDFGRLKVKGRWSFGNILASSLRDRGVIGTIKRAWNKFVALLKGERDSFFGKEV